MLAEVNASHEPSGRAAFDVSNNVLVYRSSSGASNAQFAWYGRDGKRQAAVGAPASTPRSGFPQMTQARR